MAKLIRCTSQKIHLQKYTLEQYTPTSSMTWAILRIILLLQPIDIDKILVRIWRVEHHKFCSTLPSALCVLRNKMFWGQNLGRNSLEL